METNQKFLSWREAPVGGWGGLKFGNVRGWGDGPLLAVMYQLVSECSVPESGVWVGLVVAFLWVLHSFSLRVVLWSRSSWAVGR